MNKISHIPIRDLWKIVFTQKPIRLLHFSIFPIKFSESVIMEGVKKCQKNITWTTPYQGAGKRPGSEKRRKIWKKIRKKIKKIVPEQKAEFKAKIKPCSHQLNCMKFLL